MRYAASLLQRILNLLVTCTVFAIISPVTCLLAGTCNIICGIFLINHFTLNNQNFPITQRSTGEKFIACMFFIFHPIIILFEIVFFFSFDECQVISVLLSIFNQPDIQFTMYIMLGAYFICKRD